MISVTDPKYINGYPKLIKSLVLELLVTESTATAATRVYLNNDSNSNQLINKVITCIIVNTRDNQLIDGSVGNITSPIKNNTTTNVCNTIGLVAFGYTITLVNSNNNFLVFDYPLTSLLSTQQQSGVILSQKKPRTYKRFNLEIDPNKSFISTFDPTILITRSNIVSLTFYYYDK